MTDTTWKDRLLIRLIRKRPQEGMQQAMNLYGKAVYTICKNILGTSSIQDVEEAAADSFNKLWKNIDSIKLNENVSIKSYLYSIARNSAIDKYRKNKNHLVECELDEFIIDQDANVESQFNQQMNENLIHETIDEFTQPDRTIFILRCLYCYKVKEIADILDMKVDNVESRIRRGKKKVAFKLIEKGVYNE